MNRLLLTVALLLACCAWQGHAEEGNWPAFRGPAARGVALGKGLPDRWSATENVAWKTDIAGRGWSSPVVWGNKIFLTTCESTGEIEEAKKGLYFGGDRTEPSEAIHRWKVLCLDLESGSIRWEKTLHEGKPSQPIHVKGSYAAETPVVDGDRLWCLFGNVGLFCLDHDGNEQWRREIPPRAMRNGCAGDQGPCASTRAVQSAPPMSRATPSSPERARYRRSASALLISNVPTRRRTRRLCTSQRSRGQASVW